MIKADPHRRERRQARVMAPALALAGCAALSDPTVDGSGRALALEGAACPTLRPDVTNGAVRSLAQQGNVLYLAGDFTYVGEPTGPLVALREGTERDTTLPEIGGGDVRTVIGDGAGGYFIGGNFRRMGASRGRALAHLLPDGSVDPNFTFTANGTVHALALEGKTLYVGGDFNILGGQSRRLAGAIDLTTATVTDWNPHVQGRADNGVPTVRVVLPHQGSVFLGGFFDSVQGSTSRNLAAVDAHTGEPNVWRAPSDIRVAAGTGVAGLAVHGDLLLAAGGITVIDGVRRDGFAALDLATGTLDPWEIPLDVSTAVPSLAVYGDTLYLMGPFTSAGAEPRSGVAAVDLPSRRLLPWAPRLEQRVDRVLSFQSGSAPAEVRAVAVDTAHGIVYLGGRFDLVGGERRLNFAAVDAESGETLPFTFHAGSRVHSLEHGQDRLLVAGDFSSIGGEPRSHVAAIDLDTGKALPWAPELIGTPEAIAVAGDRVVVGGTFGSEGLDLELFCGRQPIHGLAAFDSQTAARLPFPPSFEHSVYRLRAADSTLYTGSLWDPVVAIDLGTTDVRPLWREYQSNPAPFAVVGDTIYLGSVIDGLSRLHRLDAETGAVDAEFQVSFGAGELTALAADASTAYLAGSFQSVNGESRRNFAALSLPSGTLTDWDPGAWGDTPPSAIIRSLAIGQQQLFVGGDFTALLGQARDHVASIDLATAELTAFAPQVDRGDARAARYPLRVNELLLSDEQLHAAGDFYSVGAIDRSGWAPFCVDGTQ